MSTPGAHPAHTSADPRAAAGLPAGDHISLQPLEVCTVAIPVVGLTPLIPHRWSDKSRALMREAQSGSKARRKHQPKDPEQEAEDATYRLADGRPGMPATAFKAAMVDATRFFRGLPMVMARICFFVEGEGADQLVAIQGSAHIREDTPRNQTGVADLRYRRCFWPWSATLPVTFPPSVVDLPSVLTLVNAAGLAGVGDWRPSSRRSNTGAFGRFAVDVDRDVTQIR